MTPNPVRTLPSIGVTLNPDECTPGRTEHEMLSRKMGEGTSVGYVEQCVHCHFIDEASLNWWVEDAIKNNLSKRAQRIAIAAESEPFQFAQGLDAPITLEEILFQALGAASMCWESPDKAGTFNASRAKLVGQALMREVNAGLIKAQTEGPVMELAYEFYALACNSTTLDPAQAAEWQAAFERLKTRFHELLPEAPVKVEATIG